MKRPYGEISAPEIVISTKKRLRSMRGGCSARTATGPTAPASTATLNINCFMGSLRRYSTRGIGTRIPSHGLFPREFWPPLVAKRLHAFLEIQSVAKLGLGDGLERQLFGQSPRQFLVEHRLDASERLGRSRGQAA